MIWNLIIIMIHNKVHWDISREGIVHRQNIIIKLSRIFICRLLFMISTELYFSCVYRVSDVFLSTKTFILHNECLLNRGFLEEENGITQYF